MRKDSGRIGFMGFFMVILLLFAAVLGFQYLKTGFDKKQIKTEIFDLVGTMRSAGNLENIRSEIQALLERKKVTPLEVVVSLERSNIVFRYSYEIETNYIITKRTEPVTVVEQIQAY